MSKIKVEDLHCGFSILWGNEIVEVVWLQKKPEGNAWMLEFYPAVNGESCVEIEGDREVELAY